MNLQQLRQVWENAEDATTGSIWINHLAMDHFKKNAKVYLAAQITSETVYNLAGVYGDAD
jgi:hypothetical protein